MSSSLKKALIAVGVFGIFAAFHPWFFIFEGTIAGHPVSVRSLGNILGPLLVLLGLAIIFSPRWRQSFQDWGEELDGFSSRSQSLLITVATFLLLVCVTSYKLKGHHSLSTHAQDLGFFSNICWNTAQGNWFYSSFLERNFMAVHVNWILWPLSIFYKAGGDARVLLIAQAACLCLALPILWKIVQDVTGRFVFGGLAVMLFVSAPDIIHAVGNDFHPDIWQVPMLMLSLFYWNRNKSWPVLIFAMLALLAKEDVSFVLAGYGIFLFGWGRMRLVGGLIFILATGLFLYHTQVFTPQFVEGGLKSVLFDRYPFLGASFEEMAHNLIFKPSVYVRSFFYSPVKFWSLFSMFIPALCLTFLSPAFLIAPLISIMPHLLSQASTQLDLNDIYVLPLQPFIFVGAAFGLMKVLKSGYLKGRERFLLAAVFIVAGTGVRISPRFFKVQPEARLDAFQKVKNLIPSDVSLAAQQNLFSHFDTRRTIGLFPAGNAMPPLQVAYLANPEYLLGDRIGNSIPYGRARTDQGIQDLENSPRYEKIFDQEGFVVFKRKNWEEPEWIKS